MFPWHAQGWLLTLTMTNCPSESPAFKSLSLRFNTLRWDLVVIVTGPVIPSCNLALTDKQK